MRRALKIAVYLIAGILLLVVGALLFLNSKWGQNFVRGRAEAFLEGKLKTKVRIGFLGYGVPDYVVIRDLLVLDQAKDTLLSLGELKIDLAMFKLLQSNLSIDQVLLTGVHAHIYRNKPDTTFNFSYIIAAFAGSPDTAAPAPKDTTASKFIINLNKLKLNDIHFRFDDYTAGARFGVDLDRLSLTMKKLDLNHLSFHIRDLTVEGVQSSFAQGISVLPPVPVDTGTTDVRIVADNIDLKRINFRFTDDVSQLLYTINLGKLNLQLNEFGLAKSLVDVQRLSIDSTYSTLRLGINDTLAPVAEIDTITTDKWRITGETVSLAGINFRLDNPNDAPIPKGIDYSHLDLKNVSLSLDKLFYNEDTVSGKLNHLAVQEQSGVEITELKMAFNYNPQGAILDNLLLQTPHTTIQNHLEVHYASLAQIADSLAHLQLNIDLQKSSIAMTDVLLFAPMLDTMEIFRQVKSATVQVDAGLFGSLDALTIKRFNVSGLGATAVSLTGTLRGLPDPDKLNYNFNIAKAVSSRQDIGLFVADSLLSSIRLPDKFGVMGKLSGTTNAWNNDLLLATTDGRARITGQLALGTATGQETYNMAVTTDNLNLGRILKQDSLLGIVSANIEVAGAGFDINTMNAIVNGTINAANIKGYTYHNIKVIGSVAQKLAKIDLLSTDKNLQLQINGHADFNGQYPAVVADIKMDSIDLHATHWYSSTLKLSGIIHLNFPELSPDYPRGDLVWWQPVLVMDSMTYNLDSIKIASHPVAGNQDIVAELGIARMHLTGKTPLTRLGDIVQQHIDQHYTTARSDSMARIAATKNDAQIPPDYNLAIKAVVLDRPLLHGVLPGLTSFDSINLTGKLSPHNLELNITIPDLVYTTTVVEHAAVKVLGTDSSLTYAITANKVSQGNLAIWYAGITGKLDGNVITTHISLRDSAKTEQFALSADLAQSGDSQIVHMLPGLTLNYLPWDVKEGNRIVLAGGGFYIQNFGISKDDQYIKASSAEPRINSPVKFDINSFQLSNITKAISAGDTLIADGLLEGIVRLEQLSPSPILSSDFQISSLSILGDTLGELQLQVNNRKENELAANMKLYGGSSEISLAGSYFLKEKNGNDFDLKMDVTQLALKSFENIAQQQMRNSSGYVRGNLHITGKTEAPIINGELHTDKLKTTITQLNANFSMPAEKISFTGQKVNFHDFSLFDDAKNKAAINGVVDINKLTNPVLDLTINADNWQALHSTVEDNKVFFGNLFLSANLRVLGPATDPSVDGELKILKGSEVTIINPESAPQVESSKGIVIFINQKDTARRNAAARATRANRTPVVKTKTKAGSGYNVNINIDKTAKFSLILDQASGDYLTVKGEANLNAAITAGGAISISGVYALSEGAYELNFNGIKRKFQIQNGSTITFAGDPITGTNMNVTAIYQTMAPPYDLVQRQVTDLEQLRYYKQRLPFNVALHMSGGIMAPKLKFDVALPENRSFSLTSSQIDIVQAKLSQVRLDTSEMNKQVFALLILNRFVSDDPFSSGASSSLKATAMQSVSAFIGEQLNQAAGNLIKGVDLSVDLASSEDYTSGSLRQRTDLNLAASKRLLNDRLKITVGNNFELEGPQTTATQSSYIPTNLAADYMLSPDGKYTLRAYRKAYDEGVLQGYVTETGLNFILSLDYNKLKSTQKKRPKKPTTQVRAEDSTRIKNAGR
jgi:hypothetical protein